MNVKGNLAHRGVDIQNLVTKLWGENHTVKIDPLYGDLGLKFIIQRPSKVSKAPETLLAFNLHEMPACCGSFFLYQVSAYETGRGHGRKGVELVKGLAQLGGFSSVVCIVPKSPKDSIYPNSSWLKFERILTHQGWKHAPEFDVKNRRSGNGLCYWSLSL